MAPRHSGGKVSDRAYATSGGLHGVGVSGVNALSADTVVEVARNKELFRQSFSRGHPTSGLEKLGATPNRRGTSVSFTPDTEIFGRTAPFSKPGSTVSTRRGPSLSGASKSAGRARPK